MCYIIILSIFVLNKEQAMKRTILPVLILTFASFYFYGCMSTSPVVVTYSFAESNSRAATIDFQGGNPGVNFVNFDGAVLPKPEKGTYWGDIAFPAGEPIIHRTRPLHRSSSDVINCTRYLGRNVF